MSSRSEESRLSLFKQFCKSYSLNNLASLWYSILTTCFQIYIIIRAIYRFSAYISLPWPNGNAPQESINFYLLFIATSILIVPFFLIVSLMKVGNYSNDGRKLGLFNMNKCLSYLNEDEDNLPQTSWWRIIWKHSLPIGPILHLMMALCFLLPRLMTDSQMIRHGFLNKSSIWKTNLDFILKRFNGKIFNFFGLVQTINSTEHGYIFGDSSTLGQYFIRNSKSLSETFYELDECGKFSPEFLNFIIALLFLTTRYPAVFWRISKPFSLILTFQLLINSIQSIIAFNAFEVAFKIFVCDPTHLLIRYRESSSLNLTQLSTLMLFYIIILQFSSVSIYVYGLHKYREYRYARTKYFQMKYENILLVNLLPYLFAMIFFIMLTFSIGPIFYEFAIIYCGSLSISALLLLISTIVYFALWILIWIVLAIKTVWNFDYEDIESSDSLLENGKNSKQSSILITNTGKIFKIKDNIATMAIVNFIQSNSFEKNKIDSNLGGHHHNHSNELIESQYGNFNGINKKFRNSTRIYNSNNKNRACTLDRRIKSTDQSNNQSDSDGEYATFYRLKRTYSLNQKKNTRYSSMKKMSKNFQPYDCDDDNHNGQDFEMTNQNKKNLSSLRKSKPEKNNITINAAYGLSMCNVGTTVMDGNQDRISDISSGFHSNSSDNSDSSLMLNQNDKSNSLESLMQKIEDAEANCPTNMRSLSSLKTNNNKNNQNKSFFNQTEPKTTMMLSTFTNVPKINNNNVAISIEENFGSKLIEFAENPDYSKYYLPPPPPQV